MSGSVMPSSTTTQGSAIPAEGSSTVVVIVICPYGKRVEIANAAGALAVTLNGASCSIPPLSDLTSPGTVQPAPVVTPAKEIK